MADNTEQRPHRRYNPLADRWVLVSPQRTQRPWVGEQETPTTRPPSYVEDCYLCPGNTRAEGEINPQYSDVFIFDNDFPALHPADGAADTDVGQTGSPLFKRQSVSGRCRVICYSPRHDVSLGELGHEGITRVINAWVAETRDLHRDYEWVQVFENRGAAMGCSNQHPHGQVWALDDLPSEVAVEDAQQAALLQGQDDAMLLSYAKSEIEQAERLVYANDHWLVVVPYWASWPFETLLLPLHPTPSFLQLSQRQVNELADALSHLLRGYDGLFQTPFPYSMGWHGAPGGKPLSHWQLHAHFYPPLLRSASVRKFMVGFEMLGEAQRDLTPESAAEQLRKVIS